MGRNLLKAEWMLLLSITTAAAMLRSTALANEQAPSAPASAAGPVIKLGRMDPKHPLHIGADYYPKESRKHHEEGRCILNLYINADGSVSATQLLTSTGFPRLDTACLESVIDVRLLPATADGVPIARWSEFRVIWVLGQPHDMHLPAYEKSSVPHVADDCELQAGDKHYPDAARAKHEKGYCVVHATVASTGEAVNVVIVRSSGFAGLDQACIAAVKDARFTPALQDGRPVANPTDIAIYW